MKSIIKKVWALVAALCAGWAMGADIEITNVDKLVNPSGGSVSVNVGGYTISGLHIAADETLGIAEGDVLLVKKIAIAYNDNGSATYTDHLVLNDVASEAMSEDGAMAIGEELVATYVFTEGVRVVVGTTAAMSGVNESGASTTFRCRLYDHQSAEQVAQYRSIVTANNYANTNWGAMYRVVAEKVDVDTYTATVSADGIVWDVEPPETLESDTVLNYVGSGAVGALTVPAGVTVNMNGDLSVTLTNNGTFNVVGGTCAVTSAASQAVKGTVNIAAGATFKNLSGDAVAYNGSTTVNVYGTLEMANNTRWTIGGTSTLNLFGGCTVTGTQINNGAFDLYREGAVVTVQPGADASATAVTIDAKMRVRSGDARISIASGMTLAVAGPITNGAANEPNHTLSINGGGKLAGTIALTEVDLVLGSTSAQTAHFVVSGTSSLTWTGKDAAHICDNDTVADPFVTVNAGATLNIIGKDFSGWNGALTDHGWFKVNGTIVFKGTFAGSRFWREHVILGSGAVVSIDASDRAVLLYGGAGSADAAHFNLPTGTAEINVGAEGDNARLYLGNDGMGGYGTKGAGFSVGADATLTVNAPIAGPDPLAKHGAGTLVLADMSDYTGTVTLNAGTIKSATALTVQVPDDFTLNTDTESEEGLTIYTLARMPGIVYATSKAFTGFVLASGAAVELVAGDTIVCDSHMQGSVWGGGPNLTDYVDYAIVVNREIDLGAGKGIPAGAQVTISYNDGVKGVYLYGNIAAGATIDGKGLLYLGHTGNACTIADGATISCNVAFQNEQKIATIDGKVTISGAVTMGNGLFKLAEGGELTVAELAEGSVTTDVEGATVVYANGKYALSRGSAQYPAYIGDDAAKQAKFDAWSTLYSVSERVDAESAMLEAFLLNCAPNADAVATAKALFAFDADDLAALMADPSAKPTVGAGNYNGTVEIKGSATVDGTYATPDDTTRFFKATLDL